MGKGGIPQLGTGIATYMRERHNTMYVYVDQNKCQTAAVCVKVCPEVFTFTQGSKKAVVRSNPVSSRYESLVREAALKCPSRAITITK